MRPKGIYTFVWINTHHDARFYDSHAAGDGSVPRGSFVVTSPHRVYVSTTGNNPYRKLLGTPIVLEVNVRREFPPELNASAVDLRTIAAQILALTKLNWASTDSLCTSRSQRNMRETLRNLRRHLCDSRRRSVCTRDWNKHLGSSELGTSPRPS